MGAAEIIEAAGRQWAREHAEKQAREAAFEARRAACPIWQRLDALEARLALPPITEAGMAGGRRLFLNVFSAQHAKHAACDRIRYARWMREHGWPQGAKTWLQRANRHMALARRRAAAERERRIYERSLI